ncbi:spore gernimation protein [Alkalihalobacillus pseudalcaliphilus]|nr:spore gernimation protein [Alkalihalobacillus pseudalcaliphilus]
MERTKETVQFNSDFIRRELKLKNNQTATLLYLSNSVDLKTLQESVVAPLLHHDTSVLMNLKYIEQQVLDSHVIQYVNDTKSASFLFYEGAVLLFLEEELDALAVSLPLYKERSVTDSKVETVIKGPQEAFTELIPSNINLIRQRLKNPQLRMSQFKIGEKTNTDVVLLYLHDVADHKLVHRIEKRLSTIKIDRVFESEYIQEVIHDKNQWTIFPITFTSDRPDVVVAGLTDGKVVILINGSPFSIILPTGFTDFFKSAEDYYQPAYYSSLIRILRYIALFICMFTPAIYIALTTYHQDMIPTALLLSLSAQREGIPFPAFVEALLMEITFEILREAGLRMPRTIGQAVSIVGTLVIGQAAVEASIVSAAMVIVVAITAISTFVIPSYSMSIPIRILRFIFMIFASVFGIFGITVAFFLLCIHLCQLESFGNAYMSPIAPYDQDKSPDTILRFPFNKRKQQKQEIEGRP